MKIGLISDLHTNTTEANRAVVPFLIDAINSADIDVFVLAGDITPNLSEFYEILSHFNTAQLTCKKLFVPGNHDIWVSKDANMTSEQKCRVITEICTDNNFYSLIDTPYIVDNIGFCGTIGWYDYSFGPVDFNFSTEQYAEKQLMGSVWSDKYYAKWDEVDSIVAKRFETELYGQIHSIKQKVERVIVVTHHVPFRKCIRYYGKLPIDYFRAFMGSEGLGKICLGEPKITHVLFGHAHYPIHQQIKNITAICAPIGYLHNQPTEGLQTYAKESLNCFTIDKV